jgi:hypothetical protein
MLFTTLCSEDIFKTFSLHQSLLRARPHRRTRRPQGGDAGEGHWIDSGRELAGNSQTRTSTSLHKEPKTNTPAPHSTVQPKRVRVHSGQAPHIILCFLPDDPISSQTPPYGRCRGNCESPLLTNGFYFTLGRRRSPIRFQTIDCILMALFNRTRLTWTMPSFMLF